MLSWVSGRGNGRNGTVLPVRMFQDIYLLGKTNSSDTSQTYCHIISMRDFYPEFKLNSSSTFNQVNCVWSAKTLQIGINNNNDDDDDEDDKRSPNSFHASKIICHSNGKIVTGNDLWNIMTAEATNSTMPGYELLPSHTTLKVIVNEWIFDTDYPVLKVATAHEKRTISFEQILDNRVSIGGYNE